MYIQVVWCLAACINICIGQETTISSSCQESLLGISDSVWVWRLQMGWIPRWGVLFMAFPLVSAPFILFLQFHLGRDNSRLKFWDGWVVPCLIWGLCLSTESKRFPIPGAMTLDEKPNRGEIDPEETTSTILYCMLVPLWILASLLRKKYL